MAQMTATIAAMLMASVTLSSAATAKTPASAPYHQVGSIAGGDGGWDFSAFDAVGGKLYIARAEAVSVVDVASGKITDSLAPAKKGHQVLVLDQGRTILETDGSTNFARFIDAHTGAVEAQIATGAKPDAALLDPVTGLVAVMNESDGTITLIDPAKRTNVGQIAVGGDLEFAVADGKGGAFVNIEDQNAIARVDLITQKVTARIALPGCEGPTGLAAVSGGTRLITACANKVALVIDPANGALLATLPIGEGPDAVLVDEARGLAFVPCGGSGSLSEISIADPRHIAIIGTIPTQVSAHSGAIDPRDGRIYLPVAQFGAPAPGKKHGAMIPGSFAVLVFAPGAA
jgi:DNA-binding beta-propeller fold protein YncE